MDQCVKTATAVRAIRLHSTLLLLGFIKFVQKRRRHSGGQLFDCTSIDKHGDWSKNFECHFNRQLTALGFEADNRCFRHTVLDELKQHNVSEAMTVDVAGQGRKGITYGHYGKQAPISRSKPVIGLIYFSGALAEVVPLS
ncbi:hypothetical protein [Dickeya zeae]|uniref:hypothetical protein n=1 Tax=Dickeya zeae TaxID=204042 RepID=UPI00143FCD31|nr:hypothetical protein [Dickeya zeae]QIZ47349.1 hypothetical protein DWV07_10905 [Dickeya zeae]